MDSNTISRLHLLLTVTKNQSEVIEKWQGQPLYNALTLQCPTVANMTCTAAPKNTSVRKKTCSAVVSLPDTLEERYWRAG